MPFLGTILTAVGHLVVPFKTQATQAAQAAQAAQTDNPGGDLERAPSVADFAVDKAEVEKVMQAFEKHVEEGGIGGWYPEGRMNPDPSTLQTFRAGGFSIATNVDCEVWCLVTCGNEVCWPRKASVGGDPCTIGIKLFKLCDSTFDYFKLANIDDREDSKYQRLHIANEAQRLMQDEYNVMAKRLTESDSEGASYNDSGSQTD